MRTVKRGNFDRSSRKTVGFLKKNINFDKQFYL